MAAGRSSRDGSTWCGPGGWSPAWSSWGGPLAPARGVVEDVVGRYVRLTSGGREHRIYFEEAGTGPVLLALHTAGADGRQFRHLLADAEVTARHRVVSFDLPWHGRSLPPEGWWTDEDLVTTDAHAG